MRAQSVLVLMSVGYFVAVILLAHFFPPSGYAWARNTISDLASQGHTSKWIMQTGFIGFGLLLNAAFVVKLFAARRVVPADVLIMLYGAAILLTGFFCARPIDPSTPHNVVEANLHSVFATAAGFCLTGGVILYLLFSASTSERWFHLAFLILIIGFSALFGLAENGSLGLGKGVAQRLLYAVSFAWLVISQVWKPS
jgi:hypothetical membrane protein